MINDKHFQSLEKVGVLQKSCYLMYFQKPERNPTVLLKSQSCGQGTSLTLSLEIPAPSPQGQSKQVVGYCTLALKTANISDKTNKKRNKIQPPKNQTLALCEYIYIYIKACYKRITFLFLNCICMLFQQSKHSFFVTAKIVK